MGKNITVYEYDTISLNNFDEHIAKTAFRQLKSFILPTKYQQEEGVAFNEYGELKDASICMTLGIRNKEEVVRVKNYVGTISLPCGVTIEVLPKISHGLTDNNARKLVIEMLKACSNLWYKSFQNVSLSVEKLNFFEVYIALFLDEVKVIYKKGLRAGYVTNEDNENFLKGKLKFNEHIKRNIAHKEKFYVNYDLFSFDIAENRLIKTALTYLRNKSRYNNNKSEIKKFLLLFDKINLSENIEEDFERCQTGRVAKDYEKLIDLCRVILSKKSFTMYGGANDVVALMFPMETLFERYIAKKMGNALINPEWKLHPQMKGHYLFDDNCFSLRPDIILENTKEEVIIVDTKWKLLTANKNSSFGISQADMYQMYAYHTRFKNVKKVVLLYPYCSEVADLKNIIYTVREKDIFIHIAFFDLGKFIKLNEKQFGDCIVWDNSDTEELLPIKK